MIVLGMYMWLIFMVNVGKYTSPMDPMGIYTPWKIKMEPKNGWKMICLFNWVIFRFHVDYSGL